MRITESLEKRQPFFSFEFFPPRNDDGVRLLFDAIAQLRVLQPAFVSITYGAGGSMRAPIARSRARSGWDGCGGL